MAVMEVDKRPIEEDDHGWFQQVSYKFRRLSTYVSDSTSSTFPDITSNPVQEHALPDMMPIEQACQPNPDHK